jgi:hypothetical protein
MLPKKKNLSPTIGNAKDFSDIDLAKINRMYACSSKTTTQNNKKTSAKAHIVPIIAAQLNKFLDPKPISTTDKREFVINILQTAQS